MKIIIREINSLKKFSFNIISEQYTLKQALERLDQVSVKVLFITKNNKLIASLTDGDVRRAIICGKSLESSAVQIANKNPVFIKNDDEISAKKLLADKQIVALPLVNSQGEITKIYVHSYMPLIDIPDKTEVPIVIMAGGMGTRLHPYTKILPKPLIPIEGIPISERIIQSFQTAGCNDFYMIVNYKKSMIKAYFADLDVEYKLKFCEEAVALGTGGGLRLLKNRIHNTFILTNCDILILEDVAKIVSYHKEKKNQITIVCSLKNFEIPYGVVHFNDGGEVCSFEEKPKMAFWVNTGYYIVEPTVFEYIKENENVDMTDIIARMKDDGQKTGIYPISENAWLDMGQFDTMESMERKLKEISIY